MGKERYFLIDAIRGAAIVNMVIFHFLYDVFIVYHQNPTWYSQSLIHIWQQVICWIFILVSGFVWKFGEKANLQRGVFLNCCGVIISLITWFVIPSEAIWFGILNFIGCAVLVLIPLEKYLEKVNAIFGICISFFFFVQFKNVQWGFWGMGEIKLFQVPKWLYDIKVLTPFGFPFDGFASSDYFPILPWIFLYFVGYFCCQIFLKSKLLKIAAKRKIPVLTSIGQKSIWIYLLHQPISMMICILLFQ